MVDYLLYSVVGSSLLSYSPPCPVVELVDVELEIEGDVYAAISREGLEGERPCLIIGQSEVAFRLYAVEHLPVYHVLPTARIGEVDDKRKAEVVVPRVERAGQFVLVQVDHGKRAAQLRPCYHRELDAVAVVAAQYLYAIVQHSRSARVFERLPYLAQIVVGKRVEHRAERYVVARIGSVQPEVAQRHRYGGCAVEEPVGAGLVEREGHHLVAQVPCRKRFLRGHIDRRASMVGAVHDNLGNEVQLFRPERKDVGEQQRRVRYAGLPDADVVGFIVVYHLRELYRVLGLGVGVVAGEVA